MKKIALIALIILLAVCFGSGMAFLYSAINRFIFELGVPSFPVLAGVTALIVFGAISCLGLFHVLITEIVKGGRS